MLVILAFFVVYTDFSGGLHDPAQPAGRPQPQSSCPAVQTSLSSAQYQWRRRGGERVELVTPSPPAYSLYTISVCRTRVLPLPFFRFHLTMDTLGAVLLPSQHLPLWDMGGMWSIWKFSLLLPRYPFPALKKYLSSSLREHCVAELLTDLPVVGQDVVYILLLVPDYPGHQAGGQLADSTGTAETSYGSKLFRRQGLCSLHKNTCRPFLNYPKIFWICENYIPIYKHVTFLKSQYMLGTPLHLQMAALSL